MGARGEQRTVQRTHGMAPVFGHDGLHGLLILLEEHAQLPVFLRERVVLDDGPGIGALELRLDRFLNTIRAW